LGPGSNVQAAKSVAPSQMDDSSSQPRHQTCHRPERTIPGSDWVILPIDLAKAVPQRAVTSAVTARKPTPCLGRTRTKTRTCKQRNCPVRAPLYRQPNENVRDNPPCTKVIESLQARDATETELLQLLFVDAS
jgi:hypothetical protein